MNTNTCEPGNANSYLQGDLSAQQEQDYLEHLDSCVACREHLESIAGGEELWSEVHELLMPRSASDDLTEASAGDSSELPVSIRQVVKSLQPTDDPTSMGRIENFEIKGVVGSGAMGVVLKARDTSLDRVVALKVMNPGLAASGTARSRFEREAKAAAAVHHHNVVAIHAVRTSADLPYLVMPYLNGGSLQQRIDDKGPFSLSEILRIGSQIAAGLSAAHQQGVVHRDIKPSNIMLDDGVEAAIITDFGLARIVDDATMTRTGVISGTPEFMSPEQARGDAIDGKSDMFSLGSLLYMLCTGYPPFRAQTSFGVLRRITDDTPRAIRQLNPEIPVWLCKIIEDLHQKNPVARPTASDTQTKLEACLAHVYQPDQVELPVELRDHQSKPFPNRPIYLGAFAMLATMFFLSFVVFNDGDVNATKQTPDLMPTTVVEADPISTDVYKTFNLDFPKPKKKRKLVVDINRGFVEVTTHEQPNVVIEVLYPPKSSRAPKESTLIQQFSPTYDLDIDEDANQIKVDTYNQSFVLNLRIKVPEVTDLDLDTYMDGYLKVTGVDGTIITRTQHSDITLEKVSGSAQAYSYNGDIDISFRELSKDAELDFETYNGSIDLSLPAKANITAAISAGIGTFGTEFKLAPPSDELLKDPRVRQLPESEYSVGTINQGGIPLRVECAKGVISIRKSNPTSMPQSR